MRIFSSSVFCDSPKPEHIFKNHTTIKLNPFIFSCRKRKNSKANRGRYLYEKLDVLL